MTDRICPNGTCEVAVVHRHGTDFNYLPRSEEDRNRDYPWVEGVCARCQVLAAKAEYGLLSWNAMVARHFEAEHPALWASWTTPQILPEEKPVEPTKQRPGDQALPSGGQECVQDAVIAAMEESKRVGTERYGSPLMTFNGRKGFQDVADEIRDLFVYFTMIQREAEADRETLIQAVMQGFDGKLGGIFQGETEINVRREFAEIAVDRIMGWVTGQQMQR